jgi:hypothetical protein
MNRILVSSIVLGFGIAIWMFAQPSGDSLIEGFRMVEVASVADAMEQL